jgi:hypothetical protein
MTDKLTPRIVHLVEDLASDWRQLDARIEAVSAEIEETRRRSQSRALLMERRRCPGRTKLQARDPDGPTAVIAAVQIFMLIPPFLPLLTRAPSIQLLRFQASRIRSWR